MVGPFEQIGIFTSCIFVMAGVILYDVFIWNKCSLVLNEEFIYYFFLWQFFNSSYRSKYTDPFFVKC